MSQQRRKHPKRARAKTRTRPVQTIFDEVCEMEPVVGDPAYNAWLAAGKPEIEPKKLEHDTPTDVVGLT